MKSCWDLSGKISYISFLYNFWLNRLRISFCVLPTKRHSLLKNSLPATSLLNQVPSSFRLIRLMTPCNISSETRSCHLTTMEALFVTLVSAAGGPVWFIKCILDHNGLIRAQDWGAISCRNGVNVSTLWCQSPIKHQGAGLCWEFFSISNYMQHNYGTLWTKRLREEIWNFTKTWKFLIVKCS